jgi:hypothetical protein
VDETDQRPPLVVCDAGPLIHLDELGCLGLLVDFPVVMVPAEVWGVVHRSGRVHWVLDQGAWNALHSAARNPSRPTVEGRAVGGSEGSTTKIGPAPET